MFPRAKFVVAFVAAFLGLLLANPRRQERLSESSEQLAEGVLAVRLASNYWNTLSSTCPLHHVALLTGCSEIVRHGLACDYPPGRDVAERLSFPMAHSDYHVDSCVMYPIDGRLTVVRYCPLCRSIEDAWKQRTNQEQRLYPVFLEFQAYREAEDLEAGLPNPALQRTRFARR